MRARRAESALTSSGIDILKLMPRSLPSSEPGSMMMSVTIFTVRKLFSSRKNSATITTVATIESAEPGTVPSVKSRGTFLKKSKLDSIVRGELCRTALCHRGSRTRAAASSQRRWLATAAPAGRPFRLTELGGARESCLKQGQWMIGGTGITRQGFLCHRSRRGGARGGRSSEEQVAIALRGAHRWHPACRAW